MKRAWRPRSDSSARSSSTGATWRVLRIVSPRRCRCCAGTAPRAGSRSRWCCSARCASSRAISWARRPTTARASPSAAPNDNAIATALVNLGELERLRGADGAAAERLRESLRLYHHLGARNAIAYCLELLAGIDIDAGRWERGAVLLGAADRLRELLDAPVESFNRARYDQDLACARAGAGDAGFQAAWQRGRGSRSRR